MNKAVCVKSDDWEGLYINGQLKCEGHTLNEGEERVLCFLDLATKYRFNINSIKFGYLSPEDIEQTENDGCFPENLDSFKGVIYYE